MEPLVRTPRALAELTDDVDVTNPANNSVLIYSTGAPNKWIDDDILRFPSGGIGVNPAGEGYGAGNIPFYNISGAKLDDTGFSKDNLVNWKNAGNTDFLSTGTMKAGGADAADVPITGKADVSQSANLFELTDSADDAAYQVNKHGVPAPRTVVLTGTTTGLDHEGYLLMNNLTMTSSDGFPQMDSSISAIHGKCGV